MSIIDTLRIDTTATPGQEDLDYIAIRHRNILEPEDEIDVVDIALVMERIFMRCLEGASDGENSVTVEVSCYQDDTLEYQMVVHSMNDLSMDGTVVCSRRVSIPVLGVVDVEDFPVENDESLLSVWRLLVCESQRVFEVMLHTLREVSAAITAVSR